MMRWVWRRASFAQLLLAMTSILAGDLWTGASGAIDSTGLTAVAYAESPPADGGGRRTLRERIRDRLTAGSEHLEGLERVTWRVGEQDREGLVYFPTGENRIEHPPLLFVFHGHGGRPEYVARKLAVHKLWPEAICVYPQGLPTPVPLLDPQGRFSGWQKYVGDQEDRDLALFDVILEEMKKDHHIDESRVYSSGHSNGGFFTYTLWEARGENLAAIAPLAALVNRIELSEQEPKPVFHLAGQKDRLVPFARQEKTIESLLELNGCEPPGEATLAADGTSITHYTSNNGAPMVTFIHPGGHEIPPAAAKEIVDFFKEQTLATEAAEKETPQ